VRSKYTAGYHLQQARRMEATHPAKLAGQLLCAALSEPFDSLHARAVVKRSWSLVSQLLR